MFKTAWNTMATEILPTQSNESQFLAKNESQSQSQSMQNGGEEKSTEAAPQQQQERIVSERLDDDTLFGVSWTIMAVASYVGLILLAALVSYLIFQYLLAVPSLYKLRGYLPTSFGGSMALVCLCCLWKSL